MNIEYTNVLTPEEFNALRAAVGWDTIEDSLAIAGLEHTAFMVCARDGGQAVGMARVITDCGYVVYISDVVVRPGYQGQGIGREMLKWVMAYIEENIAPGQRKSIFLMAAQGKEAFYEKFGFIRRPTDALGCGMSQRLEKRKEGN
ncbi:MAG: GNAT family N-acetyltransferase [Oscillospiraceae bacterium]|nr:GNAT family N-acetyltransferase [Oscillospiraceae bacterium]